MAAEYDAIMKPNLALVLLAILVVTGNGLSGDRSGKGAAVTHENGLEVALRGSVTHLAGTIGERNLDKPDKLNAAAVWISAQWTAQGLRPRESTYKFGHHDVKNIDVDVAGSPKNGIVLVGAHYDSVQGCPGADDNASGVAVMLELSKALARTRTKLAIRCVAFANEEPPYFMTEYMGSRVYAASCKKAGDDIRVMISLETMGYFSAKPNSQKYPPMIAKRYPDTGNFIAVAADLANKDQVSRIATLLQRHQSVGVETAVFPADVPGVSWSDHASFWWQKYPGVMITDTAPYRNPNYHTASDTPDTLDYPRLATLTAGLIQAVRELAIPE